MSKKFNTGPIVATENVADLMDEDNAFLQFRNFVDRKICKLRLG